MDLYSRQNVVYKVDFPNGKSYIGITTYNLNYRKREHFYKVRRGSSNYFHNALKKYWKHNKWYVIDSTDCKEKLKNLEKSYIKEFDTMYPKGYNLTSGGDGFPDLIYTEEYRKKLSDAHTGYVMPQSQKDNIGKGNKNKIHKDATPVEGINVKTGEIVRFDSSTEAGRNGYDRVLIHKCCTGERKTHKKRQWRYVVKGA